MPSKIEGTIAMKTTRQRTVTACCVFALAACGLGATTKPVELGRRYVDSLHGFSLRPPLDTERKRDFAADNFSVGNSFSVDSSFSIGVSFSVGSCNLIGGNRFPGTDDSHTRATSRRHRHARPDRHQDSAPNKNT